MKRKWVVWLVTLAMVMALLPQTALLASADKPWDGCHFMPTLALQDGTYNGILQSPKDLLDNNILSSWCVSDIYNKTVYIEFSAYTSFTPAGYALTTPNNAADTNGARNPTCWTLKGKLNNSDDWTVLAEVENDATLPAENSKVVGFSVEHPMRCAFFRWEITAVREGDTFQMAEFNLYGAIGLQITARPATCTEMGYTVDCWKDTASGLYYAEHNLQTLLDTSAVEIPALGHTLTYHPVTAADSSAFWSCSTCGKFFSDANCETEVTGYLDEAGIAHIRDVYTPITETSTELTTGWYAVTSDLGIDSRITCTGDVHLILFNDTTLTAVKGIAVNEGNSLSIYAQSADESRMGALTVSAPDYTGIGSDSGKVAGTITINGGKVTATGREKGACIGGGASNVTVNGGKVTATGSDDSAGIGGTRSTVAVNGGTVNASGGSAA